MPDKQLAERFYKARSDMARYKANLLVGSFDVYVSNKLITKAIIYLQKTIKQTQEYISQINSNSKDGIQKTFPVSGLSTSCKMEMTSISLTWLLLKTQP